MHNNMYRPQSNGQESCYDYECYSYNNYNSTTSSSNSSYVDCTLSLATPSTRLETENEKSKKQSTGKRIGSRVSNFCWDLLQKTTTSSKLSKNGRVGGGDGGGGGGGDPFVARRCANCDTSTTPLWRNGPKGSKLLCNACGIRYKKEERRARATAAAASANSNISGSSAMESQHGSSEQYYSNNSYTQNYNHHQTQKMNCLFPAAAANEYCEHVGNGAVSFLPLMMNVADRPSLVHDFH